MFFIVFFAFAQLGLLLLGSQVDFFHSLRSIDKVKSGFNLGSV
jgi:hypothetical protein